MGRHTVEPREQQIPLTRYGQELIGKRHEERCTPRHRAEGPADAGDKEQAA